MKKYIAILLSVFMTFNFFVVNSFADTEDSERFNKMENLIDYMMTEDGPENGSLWNKENTSRFKWSYINGCMVSAMLQLYDATGEEKYKTFADSYMSPFITTTNDSNSGYINSDTSFKYTNYALDDLNSGKALIELAELNSSNGDKYKQAVRDTLYTNILKYMLENKVTAEGNLWHKNAYPNQVWLDGIYMETPFWLEYELYIVKNPDSFKEAADNVVHQIENVYSKLRNTETGLYYHGYNSYADITSGDYSPSDAQSWATKSVGTSSSYWLRGTGWYSMALVDNIEILQKAESILNIDLTDNKESLIKIYRELMDSILVYQDSETKMWYQVIDNPQDEPNKKYNYLESSGSAAISYSLMKGYNIGIVEKSYFDAGLEAFRGICDNKLVYTNDNNSTVNLTDICLTAGLSGYSSSATRGPKYMIRDGSYDYYVSEKIVENDAKGVAPLIFAYCQVLEYNSIGDIGDINKDGSITSIDATLALLYSANNITLTEEQIKFADVNNDGVVTSSDATTILLMSAFNN